jgi:hypothetical protein
MSLQAQQERLMAAFPDAICRISNVGLFWQGNLQPTAEGRSYTVRVRYAPPAVPEAVIIHPNLHYLVAHSAKPGRKLPHAYAAHQDPLCLFFGAAEWNPSLALAGTTLPWVSLWLRFFELWLVTNTWEGSGAPYVE